MAASLLVGVPPVRRTPRCTLIFHQCFSWIWILTRCLSFCYTADRKIDLLLLLPWRFCSIILLSTMIFTSFQSPDAAPVASAAPRARMWDSLTSDDRMLLPLPLLSRLMLGGTLLPALVSCTVSPSSCCLTHCRPLSCAVLRLGPPVGLCAFVRLVNALL